MRRKEEEEERRERKKKKKAIMIRKDDRDCFLVGRGGVFLTEGDDDVEGEEGKVGRVDGVKVLCDDVETSLLDIEHVIVQCLPQHGQARVPRDSLLDISETLILQFIHQEAIGQGQEGNGIELGEFNPSLIQISQEHREDFPTILIFELDDFLVLLLKSRVQKSPKVFRAVGDDESMDWIMLSFHHQVKIRVNPRFKGTQESTKEQAAAVICLGI